MTACLSDLLAEMNGADLVALWILALLALWLALWTLVTWAPVAWAWARSALARWHSRQVRRANEPTRFEDMETRAGVSALLVILPIVALAVLVVLRCGGVR